jgi:hypothetical protein
MKGFQLAAVLAISSALTFAQNHPAHAKSAADPVPHHAAAGNADNAIAAGNRAQSAQEKQLAELERRGSTAHVKPAAPPKAAAKPPKEQGTRNAPIDFTYHPSKAQNAHPGNAHATGYRK